MAGKKPYQHEFFVRQAGLSKYDKTEQGAIRGYITKEAAEEDAAERNQRAEGMGLKARYEVVSN